jgi:transposase-like protein
MCRRAERRTKNLTRCRRFFLEPATPRQRQYEALRAYFVEESSSDDAARQFGYSPGAFRVLCHQFRRDALPEFFASTKTGPRTQPQKSRARKRIVELRKRNYSVYEISTTLREEGMDLSATAVREVLRAEGFAPLPRRLDEERMESVRPTTEPIADVRSFVVVSNTRFTTNRLV